MSWMIGYLYPQKNISVLDVNLKAASDEEFRTLSQKKGYSYYIDWVINTISAPIFITYRTLLNSLLRRSPDAAYAPLGKIHVCTSKNPEVFKEILNHHRNDPLKGFFSHSLVTNAITEVIGKMNPSIMSNDIILTCDPAHTKLLRSFLNQFFSTGSIQKHIRTIEDIIVATTTEWTLRSIPITLNDEIKLLAISIMSQVFLGYKGSTKEISKASSNLISWLTDNVLSSLSPLYRDMIYYMPFMAQLSPKARNETITIFNDTVKKAITKAFSDLGQESLVKKMLDDCFTQEQIQAMVITLFVAGQDNVSNSLTHAILKLAQDPSIQEEILSENAHPLESKSIRGLLCESLRVMCPVGAVGRTLTKPAALSLTNDKNEEKRLIMQRGDDIQLAIVFAAQDPSLFPNPNKFDIKRHKKQGFLANLPHMPFGHGVHLCPGWYLYYVVSAITVSHLVKTCKITTSFKGEPRRKAGFVSSLNDTIMINLEPYKQPHLEKTE